MFASSEETIAEISLTRKKRRGTTMLKKATGMALFTTEQKASKTELKVIKYRGKRIPKKTMKNGADMGGKTKQTAKHAKKTETT